MREADPKGVLERLRLLASAATLKWLDAKMGKWAKCDCCERLMPIDKLIPNPDESDEIVCAEIEPCCSIMESRE